VKGRRHISLALMEAITLAGEGSCKHGRLAWHAGFRDGPDEEMLVGWQAIVEGYGSCRPSSRDRQSLSFSGGVSRG
jgi:hypothetical protein